MSKVKLLFLSPKIRPDSSLFPASMNHPLFHLIVYVWCHPRLSPLTNTHIQWLPTDCISVSSLYVYLHLSFLAVALALLTSHQHGGQPPTFSIISLSFSSSPLSTLQPELPPWQAKLMIHSFVQQILTGNLQCARYWVRGLRYSPYLREFTL